VPLTDFQRRVLAAVAPSDARYLAGGAAIHFAPHSTRYSDDLDFFHDAEARVATTFAADRARLGDAGFTVDVGLSQPGFVRAVVRRGPDATRVDWAHDSAWRFLPLVPEPLGGWLLHPVDLAVNKALTLAGRDEPRDFVDILHLHRHVLPLPALVWAAPGKDPGFSPASLLELLRRRGRPRPEEIARLHLAAPFDLAAAKATWLAALDEAELFIGARPADEAGCLYWDHAADAFVVPPADTTPPRVVPHYGAPGGVVAKIGS
jgi:hypothetical protein